MQVKMFALRHYAAVSVQPFCSFLIPTVHYCFSVKADGSESIFLIWTIAMLEVLELLQNLGLFSYDTFMTKKNIKARLMAAMWFLHLILLQWQYQHLRKPRTVNVFFCPPHLLGLSSLVSAFTLFWVND